MGHEIDQVRAEVHPRSEVSTRCQESTDEAVLAERFLHHPLVPSRCMWLTHFEKQNDQSWCVKDQGLAAASAVSTCARVEDQALAAASAEATCARSGLIEPCRGRVVAPKNYDVE